VLDELRQSGELSEETRRQLAGEAFAATAAYESAIAAWFADREAFPETMTTTLVKVLDLPYGENAHQRGAFYAEAYVAATCSHASSNCTGASSASTT